MRPCPLAGKRIARHSPPFQAIASSTTTNGDRPRSSPAIRCPPATRTWLFPWRLGGPNTGHSHAQIHNSLNLLIKSQGRSLWSPVPRIPDRLGSGTGRARPLRPLFPARRAPARGGSSHGTIPKRTLAPAGNKRVPYTRGDHNGSYPFATTAFAASAKPGTARRYVRS